MLEPNAIVLYVDRIAISSKFYENLLGIKPEEASPTFHMFTLSNGMGLGLKAKHSVEPSTSGNSSAGGELAFTVDSSRKVNALFSAWQKNKINIAQPPTIVPFGYTFVALDPDGHRLRIVSLGES